MSEQVPLTAEQQVARLEKLYDLARDSINGRDPWVEHALASLQLSVYSPAAAPVPDAARADFMQKAQDDPAYEYECRKLAYTEAMLERQEYGNTYRRESLDEAREYDRLCAVEEAAEDALDKIVLPLLSQPAAPPAAQQDRMAEQAEWYEKGWKAGAAAPQQEELIYDEVLAANLVSEHEEIDEETDQPTAQTQAARELSAMGIDYDEGMEQWWVIAEPEPLGFHTLEDALRAAMRRSDDQSAAQQDALRVVGEVRRILGIRDGADTIAAVQRIVDSVDKICAKITAKRAALADTEAKPG